MICPNCGAKLDDDMLYCEVCGTEIHFVPDYEPEIEQSITETLSELQFIDMDGDFVDGNFENQDSSINDDFENEYYDYDEQEPAYIDDPAYVDQIIHDFDYENAAFVDQLVQENTIKSKTSREAINNDLYNTQPVQPVKKVSNVEKANTPQKSKAKSADEAKAKVASKSSKSSSKKVAEKGPKHISDKYAEKERLRKRKATLEYIKKDDGPKISHGLSDSLYYEVPSEEELEYFDKEFEIDPFDDFAYESYFFKRFLALFKNKKLVPVLIGGLVLFVALIAFGIGAISKSIYKANSYEYQLELARNCASNGNYEEAIVYMEKAIALNPKDSSIKYTLADYYFKNEDDDNAILLLWEIINDDELNKPYAYRKIIEYYSDKDDYAMVQTVLSSCDDPSIRESFIDYTADEVNYSVEEGTYDESITLTLNSDARGTIYYTTDGSEPTEESDIYSEPIFMDLGIHRVSTLFVNNYGVKSNIATKTYTIDIRVPNPPVVLTEPGEFEVPELIEVDVQPYCKVYYTLDGSIPDIYSEEYLSPIPMPIGDSHIIFIAYNEEGVAGEITEVEYSLTLDTEIEVQAFVNCLNICNYNIGRAVDIEGHLAGRTTVYNYRVSQAIAFNESIYYIFEETLVDMFGNVTRTGNMYLGDIKTGSIYWATKDEEGVISVSEIIDPLLFTIMIPEPQPEYQPEQAPPPENNEGGY